MAEASIISQDFEQAARAVVLLRQTQETNRDLITAARSRVEELNSEGATKTAIVKLFQTWEQDMHAENVKLGQFADKAEKVIGAQRDAELNRVMKQSGFPVGISTANDKPQA
ncbi:hypothetical protein [Streptomyces sp. NPDC056632]|uniref:hypothetical protein n=1 Tax=Streptomyces sp. NPDC056632 TaxID=3345884 RepID=UPI00367D47E4